MVRLTIDTQATPIDSNCARLGRAPGCFVQRPVGCLARLAVHAAVTQAFNARLKLAPGYGQYAGARLPKSISSARLALSADASARRPVAERPVGARLPTTPGTPGC